MTAPRWWEARFEGAIVRGRLPPGLLALLEHRARRLGLRILDEGRGPQPTYRDSAAPASALHLAQQEAFVGHWERLRFWLEGEGTLRYECSYGPWRNHLLVSWLVFAGVYAAALTFCCPTAIGWVMGSWLLLWFVPLLVRHRRRTRAWVEAFVGDELRAVADAPVRVPVPEDQAAAIEEDFNRRRG